MIMQQQLSDKNKIGQEVKTWVEMGVKYTTKVSGYYYEVKTFDEVIELDEKIGKAVQQAYNRGDRSIDILSQGLSKSIPWSSITGINQKTLTDTISEKIEGFNNQSDLEKRKAEWRAKSFDDKVLIKLKSNGMWAMARHCFNTKQARLMKDRAWVDEWVQTYMCDENNEKVAIAQVEAMIKEGI